ncbi:MAG: PEP-CTERM sorting domain-containing protein [Sedimentisphaerales bacterium]|nr:PEP-CTERM sorting domain-containing protein [Sedimentisphaerales bacterium]
MRIKNLTIAFTILCVILFASRSTFAVEVKNPNEEVDTDKKHSNSTNTAYTLYYNDTKYNNNGHDKGEEWGISNPGGWTEAIDESCWMASASNMLQYEFPSLYNAETTYTKLLGGEVTWPRLNPWLEVVPTIPVGDIYYTFDDGGYQEWVFSGLGPDSIATADRESFFWVTNPINWCEQYINADHPVGLGIWWVGGGAHAITLWGIDTAAKTLTMTDSDDSIHGLDGKRTISYTYYPGELWSWTVDDFWGDGTNKKGYLGYAVAIPEPATILLFGVGSLMLFRRRR